MVKVAVLLNGFVAAAIVAQSSSRQATCVLCIYAQPLFTLPDYVCKPTHTRVYTQLQLSGLVSRESGPPHQEQHNDKVNVNALSFLFQFRWDTCEEQQSAQPNPGEDL